MTKQISNFGAESEKSYGYCQAVRVAETVYVSGQTARQLDGSVAGAGVMADQMRAAYIKIEHALAGVGSSMRDVVEETLYVTDIAAATQCAPTVRKAAYGDTIQVASTLCQVAALGGSDLLVEIKCVARIP